VTASDIKKLKQKLDHLEPRNVSSVKYIAIMGLDVQYLGLNPLVVIIRPNW
jgi:hypothetical protein